MGKNLAEDGFDPSTSGLWAQHAPTAPLCWLVKVVCVPNTQWLSMYQKASKRKLEEEAAKRMELERGKQSN